MHRLFRIKAYEAEHGPHFDEEMARKAVSKMENEDGSRGQHWSIEETTSLANQHGIRMDEKFNKYDWYVALNIVEVLGTFKKNTSYSVGTVSSVSNVYDEVLPQGQFQMPGQTRKRLVDVVITSDGESKKFTVPVDRSIISDSSIGLTISTNKSEIVKIIQDQYNIYKAKKDSIAKCDEEMKRCQDILDKLDIKPEEKEDPRIKELQNEVSELKNIIKQASQMVSAPIKQMLPQDMQNAMNEASH